LIALIINARPACSRPQMRALETDQHRNEMLDQII